MTPKLRSELERQLFFANKKVDKAIREYSMIEEGDRILVAVSGGKDSLCLLQLLKWRLKYSPVKYELAAAHVCGDSLGPSEGLPNEVLAWIEHLGVPLYSRNIVLPENELLPMNCERCSRNRRRTLFEMCQEHGCNKLALAHNLEDFAHTALMNLLSSGRLQTMAFRRDYFGGKIGVIRPLAYVREHDLVRLATIGQFPVVSNKCPLAYSSKRAAARKIMQCLSKEFKHAAENLVRAAKQNPPIGEE
ncbi:MAG: ATP-binding protein [Armatimonadota bacterium]|nr:ATP-binding protein [Armatimonadota bacterium]